MTPRASSFLTRSCAGRAGHAEVGAQVRERAPAVAPGGSAAGGHRCCRWGTSSSPSSTYSLGRSGSALPSIRRAITRVRRVLGMPTPPEWPAGPARSAAVPAAKVHAMALVAVFGLLALFSIISIVMSSRGPERLVAIRARIRSSGRRSPAARRAPQPTATQRPGLGRGVLTFPYCYHSPAARRPAPPAGQRAGAPRGMSRRPAPTSASCTRPAGRSSRSPGARSTASPRPGSPSRIEPAAHASTLS